MLDPRLNHFVAVIRHGSFTAAARAVGVTQSAVTKSIADLERQLGHKLFYRTGRGASVTEMGLQIGERAARLLEDTHELLRIPTFKGAGLPGILRIGLCPASLEWCVSQAAARLQARHANVRFEITATSFTRMIQHLENGAVDMMIGFDSAFGEWPDIQRHLIGEMRIIPFVRHGHPLAGRGAVSATDLAGYNFVFPVEWTPYGDVIRALCGPDWRDRVHLIDNFAVTQSLVASSELIGIAASAQAECAAFKRQFTILENDIVFTPKRLCCATRAQWEITQEVRTFTSMLRQSLLEVREGGFRTEANPNVERIAASS